MGKLYVGNLPFSADDDALQRHFEKVGTVTSAKVIRDRETDRSRGFGFVEMEDSDKAIEELNQVEMDGRPLSVSVAREKERREHRGGRDRSYSRR